MKQQLDETRNLRYEPQCVGRYNAEGGPLLAIEPIGCPRSTGKPTGLKMVLRTADANGPNKQLRAWASPGPESADCGSGACGRGGVLADEDTAHGWWFGNRPQPLGVFPRGFSGGLTVGEAAVTFEDDVVGGADFVEVGHLWTVSLRKDLIFQPERGSTLNR